MPTKDALGGAAAGETVSNGRRLAASAALIATGAGLAAIGIHDLQWIEWSLVGSAGVLGAAGVALARKSVVGQVFARAAAWVVFAPSACVALLSTLGGHHPEWAIAALALGSGSALWLARPMLRTPEALAEFAPSRFRRWLLGGATATTATAMLTALIGLDILYRYRLGAGSDALVGSLVLALAASLTASAYGVLRLRTWGILLGALTSLSMLTGAVVMRDEGTIALSLGAIPGLLCFVLPVVVALRDRAKEERTAKARVASYDALDALPSRIRIAADERAPYADEFEADEDEAATPAPRAQHARSA